MSSQVEISRIYSIISQVERIGSGPSRKQELERILEHWRETLPGQYRDIDQPYPHSIIYDTKKVWLFSQYHDAKLRLHMSQSDSGVDSMVVETCSHILESTSILPPHAVLSNR